MQQQRTHRSLQEGRTDEFACLFDGPKSIDPNEGFTAIDNGVVIDSARVPVFTFNFFERSQPLEAMRNKGNIANKRKSTYFMIYLKHREK